MRNASRMARYMMMRAGREGNRGNEGNRNDYGRSEYTPGNEYRGNYDMRNEGGDYGRGEMNYDIDNRFRDRRGREHYDNGRFAPMRNNYPMENRGNDGRGGERSGGAQSIMPWFPGVENRGGRENGGRMRNNYDDEDEGARMNMIGFDRPQEMQSHYPTRIDYAQGNEMERHPSMKMAGGAMGAEMALTPEIAKEWVKGMHNEDGTRGEHWNMEQVKKLMSQKGIEYNHAEVYAVINALYSDFCKVFKKYNMTSPEFYLDLAVAWLNDTDAKPNKAMNYYECIVK